MCLRRCFDTDVFKTGECNIAWLEWKTNPWIEDGLLILLKMEIFQPAMLVYQRVQEVKIENASSRTLKEAGRLLANLECFSPNILRDSQVVDY